MSGSVRAGHLDESTLLRHVVGDLSADERRGADRHLRTCRSCHETFESSERLDGALRAAGPALSDLTEELQALSADDPFARRPAPRDRRPAETGLDVRELARAAAQVAPEARDLARRIVSLLAEDESRRATLPTLDLNSVRDRLALAYALDACFDRVEESPSLRRRDAEGVLERLNREDVEPASKTRVKAAAEYTMPLADLRGRAMLLSGAAALWSGDFEATHTLLLGAWGQFAEGRGSEVLLARVEVVEALRRVVEGRPAEAAALASRASTTFSITAHERDSARAGMTSGLALWGMGRRSQAIAALRLAALAFSRAEAWSGFVTAACAAALCLASEGRVAESRRAFRDLRRRKARRAPLAERLFVRETERIALLLEGISSKRRQSAFAFSACDALLLRGASVLAENVMAAARESDEKLDAALRCLYGEPSRGFALLYACQKGSSLVVQDPLRGLELARSIFRDAKALTDSDVEPRTAARTPRESVQAEAKLVESQAQVQLGYPRESAIAAAEARALLRAGGDMGFGLALADYYEGQAASFGRDYAIGERLLKKALRVFAEFGQDRLMGRAEGALGTLYLARGDETRALPCLEHAIGCLDSNEDARHLASVLNNRAQALMRLERFDEARAGFARALNLARRLGAASIVQNVRNGLAELDFRRGRFNRALRAFKELTLKAAESGWVMERVFAQLYVAECLGRLGRDNEMVKAVRALLRQRKSSPFAPSPAMDELFVCLDQGMLNADLVAHVRGYLEDEAKGIDRPYRRIQIVC